VAVLAAAAGVVAAGCGGGGGGGGSSTSTSAAGTRTSAGASRSQESVPAARKTAAVKPLTATDRKMEAIIKAWSVRLNRNDNLGLAQLYALPTIVVQAPYAYRLRTRSEVALWFSELPCSGKVVSIRYRGKFATAVFRLGNRGTAPCDDPGMLAAARFEIVEGKIVAWAQVPVPKGAASSAQVA